MHLTARKYLLAASTVNERPSSWQSAVFCSNKLRYGMARLLSNIASTRSSDIAPCCVSALTLSKYS